MSSETTTNPSCSEKKLVELKSSDGEEFQVDEKVAIQSVTIKIYEHNEDDCGDSFITIPNVTGAILAKVIEYYECHEEHKEGDYKEFEAFNAKFVKVEQHLSFDPIHANIHGEDAGRDARDV